jgi:outer membrane protein insertion porin family
VEVSKDLKEMRLSPLLAAVLAASATIGFSKPSIGQTTNSSPVTTKPPESANSTGGGSMSQAVYVNQDAVPVDVESAQLTTVKPATAGNLVVQTTPLAEVNSTKPITAQAPTPTPSPTPTPIPSPSPTPSPDIQTQPPAPPEARVLVGEVFVSGAQGQLEDEIFRVISTRPGQATTRSQLQADVNAIFATGYFASVDVRPEDTPLGVRVTFVVEPNPVLRQVTVNTVPENANKRVVPQNVIDEIFSKQYGQTLNFRQLQEGIKQLNQWYKDNGYDLAQVVDASKVTPEGAVSLVVAEGVVEDIRVRFLNKEGQATTEEGQAVGVALVILLLRGRYS